MRLSRNYIGLIIVCILVLILVVYNFTGSPNDYKVISNNISTNSYSGYGVSFNFPSNWNLSTDYNQGHDISQGMIITVSQNDADNEAPFFEVSIIPNPPDMSGQDALNTELNSNPSNWYQISNKTTIINNNTEYVSMFTIDDPADFTENMTLEQIGLVKNGTSYILMSQAPVNDFNNTQANFNIMINSFKIQ